MSSRLLPLSADFAFELGGGLVHAGLRARFPAAQIRFIGLDPGGGLAAAACMDAILLELCERRWDFVGVDWPRGFAPHLPLLVHSEPASIAFVAGGGLAANGGQDRVILVEALDPRRMALGRLLATGACRLGDIRLAGGLEHELRSRWSERLNRTMGVPHEWDLRGGELLYLQARFSATQMVRALAAVTEPRQPYDEADDASRLVAAAAEGSQVLLLTSFPRLLRLGETLSRTIDAGGPSSGPVALFDRSNTVWTPVRLSADGLAQHSECPGFLVRAFLEADPEARWDWKTLYRKGISRALTRAGERYRELTKLPVAAHQERDCLRFANRLARDAGETLPGTFDLLCAAQATVDPNFAYELSAECSDYPDQPSAGTAALREIEVPLETLLPRVSHLSIKPYSTLQGLKRRKRALRSMTESRRPLEASPVPESKYADSSWAVQDHPFACSFPNEDLFMEDFAFHCRSQVKEKMRASETTVSELTWSLRDGVDVRETMRNWHRDKVMVKEERATGRADVGSVVFRFEDDDNEFDRYSWHAWWLAEPHDRSNLMFYATPYAQQIIGPGIARSEFGGFAVIPIPSDPMNPWEDTALMKLAEHPSEALLLGAAVATEHRAVLYFAPRPPNQRMTRLLRRSGKTIIYAKLDELPSGTLRRLKTFHILAEAGIRDYAERYIRKE